MTVFIGRKSVGIEINKEDFQRFFVEKNYFNITSHGYVRCLVYVGKINGRYKYRQTYLHRMITNAPVGMEVDHINGNRLDNRKINLRICTRNENAKNTIAAKELHGQFSRLNQLTS